MSWPDDQKRLEDLVGRGDNAAIIFLMEGVASNARNAGIKYDETLGWVMIYDVDGKTITNPYPEDLVSDKMPFWAADLGATLSTGSFEDGIGAILKKFGSASGSVDSCTVHNVHLPQYIDGTEKEKWLPLHGDPQFLLYWNLYPPEEDTWTYKPGWGTDLIIAGLSAIPYTKVVGMSTRVAGAAVKAEAENALVYVLRKVGVRGVSSSGVSVAVRDAAREYINQQIKGRLGSIGASITVKAGVLSGASAIAESLSQSLIERLTPQGSHIVLKQDHVSPEKVDTGGSTDIPVMTEWKTNTGLKELLGRPSIKQFNLASPCHLSEFTFVKKDIVCGNYIKNSEMSYCDCSADDDSGKSCTNVGSSANLVTCGAFDSNMDKVFGSGTFDAINSYITNGNKKIIDIPTVNGDLRSSQVKVYLPWPQGYYISDFSVGPVLGMDNVPTFKVALYDNNGNPATSGGKPVDKYTLTCTSTDKARNMIGSCSMTIATGTTADGWKEWLKWIFTLSPTSSPGAAKLANIVFQTNDGESFEMIDTNGALIKVPGIGKSMTASIFSQYGGPNGDSYMGTSFSDSGSSGSWDTITVGILPKGWMFIDNSNNPNSAMSLYPVQVTLSDLSRGTPYINMVNCKTPAVVADMSSLASAKSSATVDGNAVDNNYCMRQKSKTALAAGIGGRVLGTVGGIASVFVSGPFGFLLAAGSAFGFAGGNIYENYQPTWPG
jgi:hypothetical protein